MAGNPYLVEPQSEGFGPPNLAAALFGMISNLPNAYQQGAEAQFKRGQMARTERLQEPIGLDGTPNYSALVRKLLEAKGTEAIPEVLPTAWKSEFAASAGRPNVWDTPTGGGPNMSPTDQTGSALNDAAARQGQQPVDTDRRGPLNVRQVAIDAGVDPDTPGFADRFRGPGLDRPIHPSNVQGVKADRLPADGVGLCPVATGTGSAQWDSRLYRERENSTGPRRENPRCYRQGRR